VPLPCYNDRSPAVTNGSGRRGCFLVLTRGFSPNSLMRAMKQKARTILFARRRSWVRVPSSPLDRRLSAAAGRQTAVRAAAGRLEARVHLLFEEKLKEAYRTTSLSVPRARESAAWSVDRRGP